MSEFYRISFKQVNAWNLQDFIMKLRREFLDKLPDIARELYRWNPLWQTKRGIEIKPHATVFRGDILPLVLSEKRQIEVLKDWAMQTLRYRFFCINPKSDDIIFCVSGLPAAVESIFDATIVFQDATDQDYPFETWDGIPKFKEIAERWKKAQAGVVTAAFPDFKEVIDEDGLEYARRWACYRTIWANIEPLVLSGLSISVAQNSQDEVIRKLVGLILQRVSAPEENDDVWQVSKEGL